MGGGRGCRDVRLGAGERLLGGRGERCAGGAMGEACGGVEVGLFVWTQMCGLESDEAVRMNAAAFYSQ